MQAEKAQRESLEAQLASTQQADQSQAELHERIQQLEAAQHELQASRLVLS